MLQEKIRLAQLRALYGALLTKKQLQVLALHLDNDLSLKEISEEIHITRQGAHDLIRRSERTMEQWEAKLLFLALLKEMKDTLPNHLLQKFKFLKNLKDLFIV